MTATALAARKTEEQIDFELAEGAANPWVADHVLLGMSVWWVQVDSPDTKHFVAEVREVFQSLQNHLQRR